MQNSKNKTKKPKSRIHKGFWGRLRNGGPRIHPYPSPWNLRMFAHLAKPLQVRLNQIFWDESLLDYLGRWTLNAITCIFIRLRQRPSSRTQKRPRDHKAKTVWRRWPWSWQWCCHKSKNVSSHEKLKHARIRCSPRASEGNIVYLTPWFWLSDADFRCLASGLGNTFLLC